MAEPFTTYWKLGPATSSYNYLSFCLDPRWLYTECQRQHWSVSQWFGKANSFSCPRGRAYGNGYVLMYYGDAKALDPSAVQTLYIACESTQDILTIACVITDVLALYGNAESPDTYCPALVELADVRYLFTRDSPLPTQIGSALAGTAVKPPVADYSITYQNAFNGFWNMLGSAVAGSPPSFPGSMGTTCLGLKSMTEFAPSSLEFNSAPGLGTGSMGQGMNAWEAANSILDLVCGAISYDPTSNQFSITDLTAAPKNLASSTVKDSSNQPLSNRFMSASAGLAPSATKYPKSITVHTPVLYTFDRGRQVYATTANTTGLSGAVNNSTLDVYDETSCIVTPDGTTPSSDVLANDPNNTGSGYATRAGSLTTALSTVISQEAKAIRRIYRGFISTLNIPTGPGLYAVRWRDYGDETGPCTEYHTSYPSYAYGFPGGTLPRIDNQVDSLDNFALQKILPHLFRPKTRLRTSLLAVADSNINSGHWGNAQIMAGMPSYGGSNVITLPAGNNVHVRVHNWAASVNILAGDHLILNHDGYVWYVVAKDCT